MFASNKKVSAKQLKRIVFTENVGILVLTGGYLSGEYGNVGYVWTFVLGMLMSVLYMWISLKMAKKFGEKLVKSKIFNMIFAVRYMAMGIIGVLILFKITRDTMLQETTSIVILAAIILVCMFMGHTNMEVRGRMFEVLYYMALVPILIILITSMFKVDISNLGSQFKEFPSLMSDEVKDGTIWNILKMVMLIFLLTSPFEEFVILNGRFYNTYGGRKALIFNVIKSWCFAAATFVICVGIFGDKGSTLKLMEIGGLPGGFFHRQESVMVMFLVVSLSGYVSGMFNLTRQCFKNVFVRYTKKPHLVLRKVVTAVSVTLVTVISYVVILQNVDEYETSIISGREIEERDFCISMMLEYVDTDKMKALIEIPVYKEEKKAGQEYIEVDGENVEEIERKYREMGKGILDYSHIKAIVICGNKGEDKIVTYLFSKVGIPGNVLVFSYENSISKAKDILKDEIGLGEFIENLSKNIKENKDSNLYMAAINIENIKKLYKFSN